MTLSEETELLPTTTIDSGEFRTFITRLSTWKLSLSCVFYLLDGSKWVATDLFTQSYRENGLAIKIVFTDQGGTYQQLTGNVFLPNKSITGTAGQIAKFNLEMIGSGAYTLGSVVPETNEYLMINYEGDKFLINSTDYLIL
jgi:hypothetical protein